MESSAIVAKSTEFKAEESKNENRNSGSSKNKKEATVAAAVVDLDSGDGKTATITDAVADTAGSSSENKKNKMKKKDSNRILVSNTKKPFVFYLNLAKRYIKQYNDIELTALGMAIPTVVTIAEALKRDGLASHKEVKISTVNSKEDDNVRAFQKAKIQILLAKCEKLDKKTAATAAPKKTADADVKA